MKIDTNSYDIDNFSCVAHDWSVEREGATELRVWWVPNDEDVMEPAYITYDKRIPMEGLKIEVTVAEDGLILEWTDPDKTKRVKVLQVSYGLDEQIRDLTCRVEQRRRDLTVAEIDEIKGESNDYETLSFKFNTAHRAAEYAEEH